MEAQRQGPQATYAGVHELAVALALDETAYRRAIDVARLTPEPESWRRYLDRFLMTAGVLLIVAGIAAFFAWNWADLGHLTKLGLLQCAVVAGVAFAWWRGFDTAAGGAALVAAAMLVGILLAVYGQSYQTGADPYGLFVAWAVLILPWVLVGRQAGLWLLLLVLLNLALLLYWTQVLYPPGGAWVLAQLLGPLVMLGSALWDVRLASCLFALDVLALVVWEVAARRGTGWLQTRWFPRISAVIALSTVVSPTLVLILTASAGLGADLGALSPVLLALALAGSVWYYQYRRPDLFMLTIAAFAAILVITSLAVRALPQDFESLLLLAVLLIGQVAGVAYWLRQVAACWEISV